MTEEAGLATPPDPRPDPVATIVTTVARHPHATRDVVSRYEHEARKAAKLEQHVDAQGARLRALKRQLHESAEQHAQQIEAVRAQAKKHRLEALRLDNLALDLDVAADREAAEARLHTEALAAHKLRLADVFALPPGVRVVGGVKVEDLEAAATEAFGAFAAEELAGVELRGLDRSADGRRRRASVLMLELATKTVRAQVTDLETDEVAASQAPGGAWRRASEFEERRAKIAHNEEVIRGAWRALREEAAPAGNADTASTPRPSTGEALGDLQPPGRSRAPPSPHCGSPTSQALLGQVQLEGWGGPVWHPSVEPARYALGAMLDTARGELQAEQAIDAEPDPARRREMDVARRSAAFAAARDVRSPQRGAGMTRNLFGEAVEAGDYADWRSRMKHERELREEAARDEAAAIARRPHSAHLFAKGSRPASARPASAALPPTRGLGYFEASRLVSAEPAELAPSSAFVAVDSVAAPAPARPAPPRAVPCRPSRPDSALSVLDECADVDSPFCVVDRISADRTRPPTAAAAVPRPPAVGDGRSQRPSAARPQTARPARALPGTVEPPKLAESDALRRPSSATTQRFGAAAARCGAGAPALSKGRYRFQTHRTLEEAVAPRPTWMS